MADDNIVVFTPKTEDAILVCADCGQSHWYIYADGTIACSECDEELFGYVLLEATE